MLRLLQKPIAHLRILHEAPRAGNCCIKFCEGLGLPPPSSQRRMTTITDSCATYRAFIAFIRRIEISLNMHYQIKTCTHPDQIIHIASSLGFAFSKEELTKVSRDLHADFFPWAGKGSQWRENFFQVSQLRFGVNPTTALTAKRGRRTKELAPNKMIQV